MGVSSINGSGFTPESYSAARTSSSSWPRTAVADAETTQAARAGPTAGGDAVQETASSTQEDMGAQRAGTRLRVDEESHRVIAQIVDANNEVIKQIPPEELLKITAQFRELRGKLFDVKI